MDIVQERIDEHLHDHAMHAVTQEIRDFLADTPEIQIERIVEVKGAYGALFYYTPGKAYTKAFGTPWYPTLTDLRQSVMDTLALVKGQEESDVNIFSAEMFEYLSAEMLGNKPISMTIKSVAQSEVSGPRGKEIKVIVQFNERPKKLILNKTNARAIAKVLGPETDDWKGATVNLAVENVKVGANTVPSVRVKSAVAATRRNGAGPAPAKPADQPQLVQTEPEFTDSYEMA